jgi:hypothetical protein
MINLTANFVAAFSVGKVVKYNITHLQDLDREAPAKPNYLVVQVSLFDTGSSPWPINPFTLYIYDAPHASQVLTINATPTGLNDQFIRQDVVLPGTPYTTLTAAMYAATGKANMRKAVESLLVQTGALPEAFAGT